MSGMYNVESIRVAWEKEISRDQTIVKAWESVTFPTKKDGTPFKSMGKNINGARYEHSDSSLSSYGMKVVVSAWDARNGYVTDSFNAYEIARYIKDNDVRKAKFEKNLAPHESMLEDLYVYDLDDIKETIKARIQHYKADIETLSNDLANLNVAYADFKEDYKNALIRLKRKVSHYSANDIKDTIVKRYPYC